MSPLTFAYTVGKFKTPETPEMAVTFFYKWYIQKDKDKSYPLKKSEIYKYVNTKTVDRLRKQYSSEEQVGSGNDYFLKVQDYYEDDWLIYIKAHPAIRLSDKAIVVVSFGGRLKNDVIVVVEKKNEQWKITNVYDAKN